MAGINVHRLRNVTLLMLAMLAGFAMFHNVFRHDVTVHPTTPNSLNKESKK